MTASTTRVSSRPIGQRGGGVEVHFDERTGLPSGFAASPAGSVVPLSVAISLETEGREVPGVMSGVEYAGTERLEAAAGLGEVEHTTAGPEEWLVRELAAGEWRVRLALGLRREHPRVELRVAASPSEEAGERVLRGLRVTGELGGGALDGWHVEAPGNKVRPSVGAAEVSEPLAVQSASHELGSPGLVALHRAEPPSTLVVWPFSRIDTAAITVERSASGLALEINTQLAGAVGPGEWLEHGPIYLDVFEQPWDEVRALVNGWYGSMGIATPSERPSWAAAVSIFEVMVGAAPFRGGYNYSPYPTMRDLIDDLDRIAELGFQCLQLMPRHPYPSYNIHEPGDVATTYGDPAELHELVEACHRRGLRLILDVLIHGVIDKEVMRRTVDLVHEGPHAHSLDDPCSNDYSETDVEISWCRHIVEFAPHWLEGAPEHHPLLDAHPEWFMRDSRGEVSGVYTHALDIANEDWQDHFVAGCERIVREYGIDGFRFDAPFYNRFANWSEATRRHASYSSLGALELLRKLRRRLRAISDEVLLHSEPSGPFVRESLDLCYCYEEQWLIASLFGRDRAAAHEWRRVRSGRELGAWFREFDAALPVGSVSAHFIDCHDTIWWRLPGDLWRREQVGLEATRALVAIYGLRGGGYMTVAGGEEGVEDDLRLLHTLRRHLPEIRDGSVDYDGVSAVDEAVYTVLRRDGDRCAVVAVNTSGAPVDGRSTVEVRAAAPSGAGRAFDAWNDEWLPYQVDGDGIARLELEFAPYQARVILFAEPPAELL